MGTCIPTRTSELANDSGYLTSASGSWENVKSYFVPDGRVTVNQMSFTVNRTLGLLLVQGNVCFGGVLTDTTNTFFTLDASGAGFSIPVSVQVTAMSCDSNVSPNGGFVPVTVSRGQSIVIWSVSALHETYGANGITALVPVTLH